MQKTVWPYYLAWLLAAVYPLDVGAQNSAVPWSAFTMGGGVSTSAGAIVASAAGEVLVGSSAGENTRVAGGILVVVLQQRSILSVDEVQALPTAYALHQNYPNPFNPTTTIRFDLPLATDIHIVVYDLLGREVVHLVDRRLEAGYQQLVWNGRDARGRELPTGMYIVLMATPEYTKSIKTLLLK